MLSLGFLDISLTTPARLLLVQVNLDANSLWQSLEPVLPVELEEEIAARTDGKVLKSDSVWAWTVGIEHIISEESEKSLKRERLMWRSSVNKNSVAVKYHTHTHVQD